MSADGGDVAPENAARAGSDGFDVPDVGDGEACAAGVRVSGASGGGGDSWSAGAWRAALWAFESGAERGCGEGSKTLLPDPHTDVLVVGCAAGGAEAGFADGGAVGCAGSAGTFGNGAVVWPAWAGAVGVAGGACAAACTSAGSAGAESCAAREASVGAGALGDRAGTFAVGAGV